MTPYASAASLGGDRFFTGFLAGLKVVHPERLLADRRALNKAFYSAISKSEGPFSALDLQVDYDPLYGVSPWFERQLTRAQRDLLISFPNPSYSVVDVKLNNEQAEKLLDRIGARAAFIALAEQFVSNLSQR